MNLLNLKEQGLAVYREVIRRDAYRVASLTFTPDTVIDLGANIGCFTALAKAQWPRCKVIAVEPHPSTFEALSANVGHLPGVTLVQAAIGRGPVYLSLGVDPVLNSYHSDSQGYSAVGLASDPRFTLSPAVKTLLLPDLMPDNPGRFIVKLDCEGGEAALIDDIASVKIMQCAAYVAGEIHIIRRVWHEHPFDATGSERYLCTHGDVIRHRLEWVYNFTPTHKVEIDLQLGRLLIWCTKR